MSHSPENDAPRLLPRVCADPRCTIPRKPGFPMHGPHDFIAGERVIPPATTEEQP